ncbi:15242_t:CDS:2 [Gigaspora margarita]|uniref:15242_t:CDS:1 n=1 Tax=Gigaspora margarita TaxID=4874 RepID=A0ABM8W776_GIGMA|nr:15242_t:CDS:2 [Gigaspora margarita]
MNSTITNVYSNNKCLSKIHAKENCKFGRHNEAILDICYSLKIHVKEYHNLGKHNETLNELLDIYLNNLYLLKICAKEYSKLGKHYEALNDLNRLLDIYPNNLYLLKIHTKEYHKLGRRNEELNNLNRLLDIYLNDKNMLQVQGEVIIDITTELLKILLKTNCNNEEILSIRAQTYTAISKYNKASDDLNRLLKLNSNNRKAFECSFLIDEIDEEHSYNKLKNHFDRKSRGWSDILKEICPNLLLVEAKAYFYNLQFHEGASDIIKIFSQMIYDIQFKKNNDLLLSGILDTQFIENNHKNLKNAYNSKGVWNEINEKIQIEKLTPLLKDFIENYIISQDTEIPTTIDPKDKMLFRTTRSLLNKTPIKKPDIFGTYSNKGYNWKLLYSEISNGSFVDSVQEKTHKKLDRIKLEKFAKDSWDNAYRYYITKCEYLNSEFQN